MYSRFLYYALQFAPLLAFTVVSLIAVTAVLAVYMRDFSWTSRGRLLVMMLFFRMPGRYMVYLAANYIQFWFVLSMLFTMQEVQLVHLIFLVVIGLLQALSIRQLGESLRSFFGSVLLYAAFLIMDLLRTYIFDLRFDWRIAFVFCLMYVFLVLYSVYFFINSIKCLASRSVEAQEDGFGALRRVLEPRKTHIPAPGEDMGLIDLDEEELTDDEEEDAEREDGAEDDGAEE